MDKNNCSVFLMDFIKTKKTDFIWSNARKVNLCWLHLFPLMAVGENIQ